jgi:hypothetical protein
VQQRLSINKHAVFYNAVLQNIVNYSSINLVAIFNYLMYLACADRRDVSTCDPKVKEQT